MLKRSSWFQASLFLAICGCQDIEKVPESEIERVYQAAVPVPNSDVTEAFTPSVGKPPQSYPNLEQIPAFEMAKRPGHEDVWMYFEGFRPSDVSTILTRGYTHIDQQPLIGWIEEGKHLENQGIPYRRRAQIFYDNLLNNGADVPTMKSGLFPPDDELNLLLNKVTFGGIRRDGSIDSAKKGFGEPRFSDRKWPEWTIIDFEFYWPKNPLDSVASNQFWSIWGEMARAIKSVFPGSKVTAGGLVGSGTNEYWEKVQERAGAEKVLRSYAPQLRNARTQSSRTAAELRGREQAQWSRKADGLNQVQARLGRSARVMDSDGRFTGKYLDSPMDARAAMPYFRHLVFEGSQQIYCDFATPAQMETFKRLHENQHKFWASGVVSRMESYRKENPTKKNVSWIGLYFEDCLNHPYGEMPDDVAEGLPIWMAMTGGEGALIWGPWPDSRQVEFFTRGMYRLSKFNWIRNTEYQIVPKEKLRISFDGKKFAPQRPIINGGTENWYIQGALGQAAGPGPIVRAIANSNGILIAANDPTLEPGQTRDIYVNHCTWVGKITVRYKETYLGGMQVSDFGPASSCD